ncbi:MAG: molybdenum ABC transporter, periplasmic molybdate-binding protein [Solidesulfovibrio magneticus str. Maddingley MBC34]|uniref:Molybdenum ABC transporter, periplasmic molybdate-binding protein n=1 Tax=Solidesulfovibrio magneticus str. Maddingley MBC34 TaxID=1206767 RepID=K6GSZ7_9BACT|nr:MAG: molybdenum ABC transporter, periplasmic molybdate-binding protein [Solidesulfovibrio magneticus str. Maddingley MBC34]
MMRRIACLCAVLAAMLCLAVSALAENLTLAAGAGYKKPVTALAKAFEAAGGVKTDLIFGNMGQIITQAKGSGAIDILVGEKNFLDKAGLVFSGSVPLGHGVLVVAWPKGKTLAAPGDVAKPEVKRLAMPDPAKAIYGKAAAEYLKKAGLEKAVADKLLVVGTVPQVTAYIQSGEVDAGFVNRTDVMDLGEAIGGYLEIDPALYAPIELAALPLADSKNAEAIKAFAAFLATPQAREILKKHGL